MFARVVRIWQFVKRHKKKLFLSGLVLYGGRYLYGILAKKFQEFNDLETAECLQQARKQHHFDNNQRTCNMTVISMLPTLREKVISILNTEVIISQIKANPTGTVELWEELKLLSVTRVITAVYGCVMMCMMLRIQLNIIGGYMYVDNANKHKGMSSNIMISVKPTDLQEKYLGLIREFFNNGVDKLVIRVKDAVYKETRSISLKEKVSIKNFESLVKHIRERVENGQETCSKDIPTFPLCEYLIWNTSGRFQDLMACDDHYSTLLQETRDIVESKDFHEVFALALDRGFAKLLDYLTEHLQKSQPSKTQIHEMSLSFAKVIPFLNNLVYKLVSDAPNPLVQELLLMEKCKTLAANIYEAFSQADDENENDDDEQFS